MPYVEARVAFLSSPFRLCTAGFFVTLAAYLIQVTSGVSPWLDVAPVEISSNVVAFMAFIWCAIQLRTHWGDEDQRRAWIAFGAGWAILSFEGSVADLLTLEVQSLVEMSLSIVMWIVASILIIRGFRRYSTRRYVVEFMVLGLVLQVVALVVGLAAALSVTFGTPIDSLKVLNDTGELLAVFAYLFALLLAEFASTRSEGFSLMLDPNRFTAFDEQARQRKLGQVIDLKWFRNQRQG